jgi:2,3-bisphosphoglycerate-independent phosphoglycerate mutase
MNILLIILDGLGDRPAPELGGKTPLEAARTPNLDRLAAEGINGLLHPKSRGYPLGSPLALHLMFGYPEESFPDRGPLLARARGLELPDDAVVLAARFAAVVPEAGRLRLLQRFIRGREEACRALAEAIAEHEVEGLRFRYVYSGEGDGMLFIAGGASHEVTDTDPLGLDLPVLRSQPRADAPDSALAARTAGALNRYLAWAHGRLAGHSLSTAEGQPPINFLITKWAGTKPAYEPFAERWGLRPAGLPDEEVVCGLLLELGFHVEQIEDEEPEADLRRRLAAAEALLAEGYEFVLLHCKYPDPISHCSEPLRVRETIEALDRAMDYYWRDLANDPELITVLATDHTTPSVWAHNPRGQFSDQHGGESVPIAIRGGNVRVDAVSQFGERAAAAGVLGHLRGADFMPVLLTAAERTNMYDTALTPKRRLYRPRPEQVEPFVPPEPGADQEW